VLVSKDEGKIWKSVAKDDLLRQPTQSLEASNDGQNIWAISQKMLLYSADGGTTWDAKELPFASAGNLRIHRQDDNNLFITSNMGLYTSKDAGRNWNRADVHDLRFQDVASSGNALVVSLAQHGLIASFDSGKTWKHIDGAFAEGFVPVVRTQRTGAVVAASATEGLLSYEPDNKGTSADGSVGVSSLVNQNGSQPKQ
jgi:photosystem II stability/assembly factor-like uncharacterized protein